MSTRLCSIARKNIIFSRDGWRCQYCGVEPHEFRLERNKKGRIYILPYSENGRCFEVDHILPHSRGGNNSFNNLCTSCWECNNKKSNRIYKLPKNFPVIKFEEVI